MKSPTESDAPRHGDHEDPPYDSGVPPFIEAGAFDFLPKSADPVTEVPDIVAEVEPGDPLTERLEAILSHSAGPDVEFRTLFEEPPWFLRIGEILLSRRGIGSLTSILLHLLLLIALAVWGITVRSGSRGEPLQAGFSDEGDISMFDDLGDDSSLLDFTLEDPQPDQQSAEYLPDDNPQNRLAADESARGGAVPDLSELERTMGGLDAGGEEADTPAGRKATSGRTAAVRRHGLPGREGDTTDESEAAVEAGLAWLAAHQLPDGGWAFDLTAPDDNGDEGECGGKCSNSHATSGANQVRNGLYPGRMAATGIALLAFLGAGYDHRAPGLYRETVEAGLRYIKYRARQTKFGIDFREAGERYGMYTHAIVTVTVCEAYELTDDPELKTLAHDSALFIVNSQRDDGGWRYEGAPDSNFFSYAPGDTSVSGWQMLALKSAMSAGFSCSPEVFYKAGFFLDSVQLENNTLFRYMAVTRESEAKMWGTTAVGVLMREYIGWKQRPKYMKQAVRRLSGWISEMESNWNLAKKGFDVNRQGEPIVAEGRFRYNLYFAYYGSLALHHAGGSAWHKSFAKTRRFLVETQSRGEVNPHEKGSWLFYDRYMNDGGRLLNTAMSVLILETPYRYLPMYK